MIITYTLNAAGQQHVAEFVAYVGKPGLKAEAWFSEAEFSADENGGHASIEVGAQYAEDGRPHTLALSAACFTAAEVDDE
jgi:hypothetical protein